jgi:hypothetical protein
MWKRSSLLFLIPCLAIAVVLLTLPRREPEPKYQGHSLSYWLFLSERDPLSKDAAKAVSEIGTNALPLLMQWIRYELPPWRKKLAKGNNSLLQGLVRPFLPTKRELLADATQYAFRILGTNAASAIPELTGLMRDTSARQTAIGAMGALSLMRTNGLAPLISAIQDPQYPLRIWAVTSITYMPSTPTSATITTPLLIQCLSDTANSQVPLMAAIGLGRHNSAPQLSIPALTRCLETPGASELLRGAAVQSLGLFGAQATNALPALTNALADASLTVRRAATNALQQITSEPPTNTPAP